MDFEISKEDWKRELRNKSPIYAAYDENKNLCEVKKKVEENDTDADSGLLSIDGDSARDRALCNNLLEHDILLMRQDSGLSSENSDISSPYLRSNKEQQVFEDTIAAHNKPLSRTENSKQVIVNKISICPQEPGNLRGAIFRDPKDVKHSKFVQNNSYNNYNAKKSPVDEENCFNQSAGDNDICRGKPMNGTKQVPIHDNAAGGKHNRKDELRYYAPTLSYYDNTNKQYENTKGDRNINKREMARDIRTSSSTWNLRRDKLMQNSRQKSQNRMLRDELCQSYKETADKITETVDQLLYKDLMCAYLTEEILSFSNNNFSVDEEMLVLEEKFLEDQIFNSTSLLQTLENITDHQQVALKLTLNEKKRIEIEIKEKILKLQHMERAFRNVKFKHAPKQLKRYCSVESLLSDVDQNECEKKKPCDIILDEKEEFTEEISLV